MAGWEVTGVDVHPQPHYPGFFVQADALAYVREHGSEFDAIHASPPCQRYSVVSKSWNGKPESHPDLVDATRAALQATGKIWIIENVVGAPLRNPVTLCGTMFPGLRVIRHRLFESSVKLTVPPHGKHPLVKTMRKDRPHYSKLDDSVSFVSVTGGGNSSVKSAAAAMGINWMTKAELNEAIPPAYTECLGRQLKRAWTNR
jgi:DNA (cytosine-5)-methyltransferase 1